MLLTCLLFYYSLFDLIDFVLYDSIFFTLDFFRYACAYHAYS